jgi:uncharacterized membrane protein
MDWQKCWLASSVFLLNLFRTMIHKVHRNSGTWYGLALALVTMVFLSRHKKGQQA